MQQHDVPTLDGDLPEMPTRFFHDPLADDYSNLVFSEAEKIRLNTAAFQSRDDAQRVLDGDHAGWIGLRAIGVTRWWRAPKGEV